MLKQNRGDTSGFKRTLWTNPHVLTICGLARGGLNRSGLEGEESKRYKGWSNPRFGKGYVELLT